MPLATITTDVYPIDKAEVRAAAEGLRDVIGDRPEAWSISISSPEGAMYWLVDVSGGWRGQPLRWVLSFWGPEDQTARQVIDVFRLSLRPYPN
jgi:hypothetical protein